MGVLAPRSKDRAQEAPPAITPQRPAPTPIPDPSPIEGEGSSCVSFSPPGKEHLAKLAAVEADLADARAQLDHLAKAAAEVDGLHKRLADQAAEIERLRASPLPPRAAASRLAKAVGKSEDGEPPLSPEAFAEALEALPAGERAHLIMKAALSRPIAL